MNNSNVSSKDIYLFLVHLILLGVWIYVYYSHKDHSDLIGKTESYEQITSKAALLERKYVDQKALNEKAALEWSEEKSKLNGKIELLSNATFLIREKARDEKAPDLTYQGQYLKYVVHELRFENGPPIGYVLIFDDGKVTSKIYNHEIIVHNAIAQDQSTGKYSVVAKADYVLKSPAILNGWYDKPFALNINSGTAYIDPTKEKLVNKKFYLWSPRLNANLNFDGSWIPGLGVSLMGYGVSKNDLDLKFLQIGLQYSDKNQLNPTLVPVLYRPFSNYLPNTYIGPGVYLRDQNLNYFLGLQIGF